MGLGLLQEVWGREGGGSLPRASLFISSSRVLLVPEGGLAHR